MDGWGHKQMYFPLPTCRQLGVELKQCRPCASGRLARAQTSRRGTSGFLRSDIGKGCGITMQMRSCCLKMGNLIRSFGRPSACFALQDQPVPAASVNKSQPCLRPQLPEQNRKLVADRVLQAGLGIFALLSYPPLHKQTQRGICLEILSQIHFQCFNICIDILSCNSSLYYWIIILHLQT